MSNKTLQNLIDEAAGKVAANDTPAELENLGQELARKLQGGQGATDDEFSNPLNISCPIHNNTGCPV